MAFSPTKISPSARRAIHRAKASAALRNSATLPKSARLLGLEFLARCDRRTGMCHPSVDRLATALACDEKTVRRGIAALVAHGFLVVIKRGGRLTDQYHLAVDKLAALADTIAAQVSKVCDAARTAGKAARASAIAKGADVIKVAREATKAARKAARAARDAIQGKDTLPETATSPATVDRTFCPRVLSKNINILGKEKVTSRSGSWKAPGTPRGQILTDQQLDARASARFYTALQQLGVDVIAQFIGRDDADDLQAKAIRAERFRPGTGLAVLRDLIQHGATA